MAHKLRTQLLAGQAEWQVSDRETDPVTWCKHQDLAAVVVGAHFLLPHGPL